jgi:hypothetical protein
VAFTHVNTIELIAYAQHSEGGSIAQIDRNFEQRSAATPLAMVRAARASTSSILSDAHPRATGDWTIDAMYGMYIGYVHR